MGMYDDNVGCDICRCMDSTEVYPFIITRGDSRRDKVKFACTDCVPDVNKHKVKTHTMKRGKYKTLMQGMAVKRAINSLKFGEEW